MEFVIPCQLDGPGVRSATEWFDGIARATDDIELDLSCVETLDGSGLGALMHLVKRKRAIHHRILFKNLTGQPRDLLADLGVLCLVEFKAESKEIDV